MIDAVPSLDIVRREFTLLKFPTTELIRPAGRVADTPRKRGMLAGLTVPIVLAGLMVPSTLVPVVPLPIPLTVTTPVGETDTIGSAAIAACRLAWVRASATRCRCRVLMDAPARILWTHCVTCCGDGVVWRIDSNIAVTCWPAGVVAEVMGRHRGMGRTSRSGQRRPIF